VETSRNQRLTSEDWLKELGTALRQRRFGARLTQEELARRADVALSALKNLESGAGANLTSLVKVVRALGCEDWLAALALTPEPTVSPMELLRQRRRQHKEAPTGRRRVRHPRN
jgi:transcriptional regulator with XRE-family HTH domain